ncbi:MAG: hypothetical protein Q8K75_13055 [Chlamydiales bacterium]|nr:hypothetical protein [Chlamydiales bacterium]
MLQFFRKYQRYLFIAITIVIVLSFSFFGTYGTIETTHPHDRLAFVAVDGSKVNVSEVESMALFLSSDAGLRQNMWAGNSISDGVLTNDFLVTGLAEQLVSKYAEHLGVDLQSRLRREKRAKLYVHPSARFISTEAVWNHFAPNLKVSLDELRGAEVAESPEAFKSRVNLFLAQQVFPAPMLTQVLRYQEQQYPWLQPDPNLPRQDLSLFGYHTLEDWFGPRFVRLTCQFIINSAIIAEQKGYEVTIQEALADLLNQADITFKQLSAQTNTGAANSRQYMNDQLRRTGLDEYSAAKVWRQVLLFRRLFDGVGNAVFVDPALFQQYTEYALETAEGDLYVVPEGLRLSDFRALQKLEVYLNAVSDKASRKSQLDIPTKFLTVAEVQKSHPELVQKRYMLEVAEASKKSLQARVGVKEMWNWETQDDHWEKLKKEFPELAVKKTTNSAERFTALEALAPSTRAKVDEYAREAIVSAHPEWIEQALEAATPERVTVGIRLKGGTLPLRGVEDRQALIALLDLAPLGGKETLEKLQHFSGDGLNYYRISVIDRDKNWEVLSFADAAADDTLNQKILALLDPFYEKLRVADPGKYRKGESWKPLEDVQDLVAAEYYKDLITAVEKDYKDSIGKGKDDSLGASGATTYRLLSHVRNAREQIKKNPSAADSLVAAAQPKAEEDKLAPTLAIAEQFKLQKTPLSLRRSDDAANAGREVLFTMEPKQWSNVAAKPNGELWFFQLASRGPSVNSIIAGQEMDRARHQLGADAQRQLMYEVLDIIQDKNAISFAYLERDEAQEIHRSAGGSNHENKKDLP